MAILTILSICLVRNLKVTDVGRKQLVLEMGIGFLYQFFDGILGKRGRRYVPYLITVALYVGVANLIGLFGFKPPTKDLNVTVCTITYEHSFNRVFRFSRKGLKKWLKSFAEPIPIIAPDQHTGNFHPAAFPVYAVVWQRPGFLRRYGIDQAGMRTDRAHPLQLLLRHF